MGIGLIEVLWKTVSEAINCCIGAAITYHDVLHKFRVERGVGTTSLEANMVQQLTLMR